MPTPIAVEIATFLVHGLHLEMQRAEVRRQRYSAGGAVRATTSW